MPMSRHDHAKLMKRGVDLVFGLKYPKYAPEWNPIFNVKRTNQATVEETLISGFGMAEKKSEGADIALDQAQSAWTKTYLMHTIGLGFEFTSEAVDDNLYVKVLKQYTPELLQSFHRTKEVHCASVLNQAFNGAFPGGDGEALLSTAHPLQRGGVLSNTFAAAADLSEDSLRAMLIQIRRFRADNGDFCRTLPRRLIVSTEQMFDAEVILKTAQRPGTSDNDNNPINSMSIFSNPTHVMNYLTNPTAWFIQTDAPEGLTLYERQKLATHSYVVDRNLNVGVVGTERYTVGFTNPRCLAGSQ